MIQVVYLTTKVSTVQDDSTRRKVCHRKVSQRLTFKLFNIKVHVGLTISRVHVIACITSIIIKLNLISVKSNGLCAVHNLLAF